MGVIPQVKEWIVDHLEEEMLNNKYGPLIKLTNFSSPVEPKLEPDAFISAFA